MYNCFKLKGVCQRVVVLCFLIFNVWIMIYFFWQKIVINIVLMIIWFDKIDII